MTDPIEILVHTMAPSKAKDDERYRKQAQGFLSAFTGPSSGQDDWRRTILTRKADVVADPEKAKPLSVSHVTDSASERRSSSAHESLQRSASQQSQLGISSDSIQLPPIKETSKNGTSGENRPTAYVKVARTPFFKHYKRQPGLTTIPETVPRRCGSEASTEEVLPSVIPNSHPSDLTAKPPRAARKAGETLGSERDSPSPKRRRLGVSIPETSLDAAKSTSSKHYAALVATASSQQTATPPPSSPLPPPPLSPAVPPTSSFQPPSSPQFPSTTLIRTIRPPHPPTDTLLRDTQLTKPVRASTSRIRKYYRPSSITRPFRPLERGYWSVRVGGEQWSAAATAKFWEFLTLMVRDGRAGWGTWAEIEDRGKEERMKLWCWGEVAVEMWLILFLASESKVQGSDAAWVDAEGDVVVKMG